MSDTFRKEYKPLTDQQKSWMGEVKDKAEALLTAMNSGMEPDERSDRAREMAVAKTNLEQSVMWAVKAITG